MPIVLDAGGLYDRIAFGVNHASSFIIPRDELLGAHSRGNVYRIDLQALPPRMEQRTQTLMHLLLRLIRDIIPEIHLDGIRRIPSGNRGDGRFDVDVLLAWPTFR